MKSAVSLLLLLSVACADAHEHGRSGLKKWGMAYCLATFQPQGPEHEADQARGAYFQLGQHNSEEAYASVRAYFNHAVAADTRVMQSTSRPNHLMRCLDPYEAPAYSKLIHEQDRWLASED